MKNNLVFPELHFVRDYTEENKKLLERFDNSAVTSVPTTVDIIPEKNILTVSSNGQCHHYNYKIPVNFDMEKYKKIYESLKKSGLWLSGQQTSKGIIIPDIYREIELDFDSMSRENLLKYIKSGKTYRPDTNLYFDTKLFDVEYVRTPHFIGPDGKMYECQAYRTPTLNPVFRTKSGKFDYDELLRINVDIIKHILEISKYNCIYTLVMDEIYLTDELTIHVINVGGTKISS
jgi:hypothetical protein